MLERVGFVQRTSKRYITGMTHTAEYYRERRTAKRSVDIPCITPDALELRESFREDLKGFAEYCFSDAIYHKWSNNHLIYLRYLSELILRTDAGYNQAVAMPRGSGKTTLAVIAILWAILYRHKRFIIITAATQDLADDFMRRIKMVLETNDSLFAMFPADIAPIRQLEGIPNRAKSQVYEGQRTYIEYSAKQLVFPTVPGANAAGSVIRTVGITGSIRGANTTTPAGEVLRPDFVLIDDPQTTESARSVVQCAHRTSVIDKDIMRLGGPGKRVSILMTCTVIEPGDVADTFLDRKLRPEWRGLRTKAVETLPKRLDLWKKYHEIRTKALIDEEDRGVYDDFYKEHWDEMHEGAKVNWEGFCEEGDLDALQSLMHVYLNNKNTFFAELQNSPIRDSGNQLRITDTQVRKQLSLLPQGRPPQDAVFTVMACDINYYGMHWVITSVTKQFAAYVIDYGKHPREGHLWNKHSANTSKQAIYDGILAIAEMAKNYGHRIDMITIDSGFEMETVFSACHTARRLYGVNIYPSRGRAHKQFKMKDVIGHPGEYVYLGEFSGKGRVVVVDVDVWKFRVLQAFLQRVGAPMSISLFGDKEFPHLTFSRHITSEILVDHYSRNGEEVFEWRLTPGTNNDYFDSLTVTMAMASLLGIRFTKEGDAPTVRRKPRIKKAEYTQL